ncbi:MAG: RNA polymerase Rpb4 family protein [Candidatus Methanofastidiosia archaeon]|jgi:DNA-directed RNA polymerase subunit F
MIGKKVIDQNPVTLAEVRAILSLRQKGGELLYEQSIALDHANKFSKLKTESAQAAVDELLALGIKEDTIYKLVDIYPRNQREVQMLFSKERFTSDKETLETIVSILEKHGES